jgi:acid phosphatase type 7
MLVNWVDRDAVAPARVWYRPAQGGEWLKAEGGAASSLGGEVWIRRAELTGLAPDTVYEFAPGDAAPPAGARADRFRTAPDKLERPVRFISGGDTMHRRDWFEAMNRAAGAQDPDFALIAGDLAYADDKSLGRWLDWFAAVYQTLRAPDGRLVPMVIGIGNHEVKGHYDGRVPEDAVFFHAFFALPQDRTFYALDFGSYLSLLLLDTDHTRPIAGAQTEWLASALAARADRRFVFPAYHYPAYGTTKRPKYGVLPSEHPRSQAIRREWSPLFEKNAVTAVFENDHHAYKRTYPIREGRRDDQAGVVYLGDGAWGVDVRPVVTPDEAWYLARSESRRHVFVVTLSPTGEAVVQAIDSAGEVFDRCTLAGRSAR